jgi:hypothetical protein
LWAAFFPNAEAIATPVSAGIWRGDEAGYQLSEEKQGFCKVSEVTPKSAPALCRCSRHSDDEHLPHCPSHCGK